MQARKVRLDLQGLLDRLGRPDKPGLLVLLGRPE